MSERSKRLKWRVGSGVTAAALLVAVVMVAAAMAGPVGTASGFEDDDANLITNGNTDWNSFAPVTWLPTTATTPTRTADKVAAGWTFKGIEDWQATTADSGFAGGTKQDNDCPSVISAKAPNKDDLKRIYLSTKTGANGHTYLNLAWVRIPQNTTSPSAHIGFEFNKGNNGACATGGLVKRSAGDLLVVYDFEGGGTPVLTLRKWVLTGSCDVGSDIAPCWGVATNLTAGGFAEGAVNTGSTVADALTPPALGASPGTSVNSTLGISEFGEAGIDLTAAGVFTAGTCESFGKAYGVSRSSGSSGTAQMKDLVGPANFTLSNCGSITIKKHTDPRGLNQSFGYTTTGGLSPSTFNLNDTGNTTGDSAGNTRTYTNVAAGNYTVTEGADPAGFKFTDLSCTASGTGTTATPASGSATRTASITIAGGGSVTCTYTNTQQLGALKVTKTSVKPGGTPLSGAHFRICTNDGPYNATNPCTAAKTGSDDAVTDVNGVICLDDLAFGDYYVSEKTAPSGYAIDDSTTRKVPVNSNAKCSDATYAGASTAFTDTPLTDVVAKATSQASGGTKSTITCVDANGADIGNSPVGDPDPVDPAEVDANDLTPGTYTCTIVIDP